MRKQYLRKGLPDRVLRDVKVSAGLSQVEKRSQTAFNFSVWINQQNISLSHFCVPPKLDIFHSPEKFMWDFSGVVVVVAFVFLSTNNQGDKQDYTQLVLKFYSM